MEQNHNKPLDLAAIRAKLAGKQGRQYWRSLEELADTEEFRQFLEDEFPQQARPLRLEVDRRQFFYLMASSLALAGLSGCRFMPAEKIVPYVKAPEEIVPGKPLAFATSMTFGGYALGLLATSYDGRPIKLEGNPDHPASLGATDTFAQAALLNLYDPDRSQNVLREGAISTWEDFLTAARAELEKQRAKHGAGLRILTETITSPTLADQIQALLRQFPAARWHQYEPVNRDNARAGARAAFGEDVHTIYKFDKADVILSLDADFLISMPGSVRYARDFADRRRAREGQTNINRLYAVESTPGLTGAAADHRLALRAGEIEGYARAMASALGVNTGGAPPASPAIPDRWISTVAADLQQHRGTSLVVAGDHQPAAIHALAHAMNQALGNVGQTVIYTAPVEASPIDQTTSLQELVDDMQNGRVEALFILSGNPAYTAPADLEFGKHLAGVPFRARLGLFEDETSALCQWHIPETHFLEMWSDARAYDGTVSLIQPLIAPLYNGKSAHDLLAALAGQPRPGYDIVRDYWIGQNLPRTETFDRFWRKAIHDGMIPNTALPPKPVTLKPDFLAGLEKQAAPPGGQDIEIIFQPDPTIWDGRFANNGWLQELPKPLTKLTWDNAAHLSPALAQRLSLSSGQQIELTLQNRKVVAPVWILPGHPDNAITVTLGYGRERAGQIGNGIGFNAYLLRASDAPWFASGVTVRTVGTWHQLVSAQDRHSMEGRDIVVTRKLDNLAGSAEHGSGGERGAAEGEEHAEGSGHQELSMYPEYEYEGYKWAMSIDLTTCIGCNACVIACQAENNIPVVGKDQVARGREMHWIRIDRYYAGNELDNPETHFQPVPCMHCERAPCEPVCPVAATVHSQEGLNQMVYNRCIGTRYCSNNCPYKVRRFNFYKYVAGQPNRPGTNYDIPVLKLMANPNVTIRGRGVMEKCTYCVQRINAARIEAKKTNRTIRDGEIVTACQQVCPTKAIIFGNLNDARSQIAELKKQPHDYSLLEELNTKPRTTYLAKVRNPNPELETEHQG